MTGYKKWAYYYCCYYDDNDETFDVETNVVWLVGSLGANLAMIESIVGWPHVLNDQTPLARSLVVLDIDARVPDEREEANCQRMDVVMATPRDLYIQHVTWLCLCPPCHVTRMRASSDLFRLSLSPSSFIRVLKQLLDSHSVRALWVRFLILFQPFFSYSSLSLFTAWRSEDTELCNNRPSSVVKRQVKS